MSFPLLRSLRQPESIAALALLAVSAAGAAIAAIGVETAQAKSQEIGVYSGRHYKIGRAHV